MFRQICFCPLGGDNRAVHELAYFENKIVPADSVRIAGLSLAALYGKGVFTTLPIFDGVPFLWDKHWRRLLENASRLEIDTGRIVEGEIATAIEDLVRSNHVTRGRARITIFDETATELWAATSAAGTRVLIVTADHHPMREPIKLSISPYRINSASPLAGVKSSNYTEKILALAESRSRGFAECVQLNERDEIASAAMANIFWMKDGELFTPSLTTGCLAGTTREHVIENFAVRQVSVDELRGADEIFLTSAGLGVARVSKLDGAAMKCRPHPILDLLPQA